MVTPLDHGSSRDHPKSGHFTCSRERTDHVLPTRGLSVLDPSHSADYPRATCLTVFGSDLLGGLAMQCPQCQHENSPKANFCEACGTSLARPNPSGLRVASYADLQREVEHLAGALSEAREQQTATSEILHVISSSPTNVQPVLDAVAENAARLCGATDALIHRLEGEGMRRVAHRGTMTSAVGSDVLPVTRDTPSGRAICEQRTIHIDDILEEFARGEYLEARGLQQATGFRTILSIPLVRENAVIGVIVIRRVEVRPFTEKQMQLAKTFADQAVIAIENVRLFKELEEKNRALTEAHAQVTETLEQQTATSEILRVISSAHTDAQPVFDTIVQSAVRLCNAANAAVFRTDGRTVYEPANYGSSPEALATTRARYPRPLDMETTPGIAILTRSIVQISDVEDPSAIEFVRQCGRLLGFRRVVTVPMLREGEAVGAIIVARREPGRFSDAEVEVLKTFADQAVIAIENVRLFTELQEKNRALTAAHAQVMEALDQQTATSEILRVISSSPTNVDVVFDTILASALRLCDTPTGGIFTFDGRAFHIAAAAHWSDEFLAALREAVILPGPETPLRRVGLNREMSHVADIFSDPSFSPPEMYRLEGMRTSLAVPMLKEGRLVGALTFHRREVRPFTEAQIALIKTFADQAVIPIENVRLFTELQARTGELTQSVEKLTALGEVSRAVSSTLDVETVLGTVVSRARDLAGADGCLIYEYDAATEQFHVRATDNLEAEFGEAMRRMPIRKGEGVSGRAAEMREPFQVADITQPGIYASSVRDVVIRAGYRAALSVPLRREDEVIGSLILIRKAPGEFPPEVVDVLKTFATQSALAIQNARLFREIADKSAQLEAASRHKSEFLANMSHELRTPLNAIIGFSEILAEKMFGEINEKQTEYLQDILESGLHLLSLINDILDLSKIEAGRMELERSEFHLPDAIDNALILVRERASRRGIKLGSTIDERLGMLSGDERKVKQVLLNLLSNALKFTPEGGRIDVGARLHDGVAEVSVADTGIGIAPADQEAVFEEFRQVGAADKKSEGTGLGLALSRKFIELHGGRIWVESEEGKGSTFRFTLPST